jgi:hypothetical protein
MRVTQDGGPSSINSKMVKVSLNFPYFFVVALTQKDALALILGYRHHVAAPC